MAVVESSCLCTPSLSHHPPVLDEVKGLVKKGMLKVVIVMKNDILRILMSETASGLHMQRSI